MGAAKLSKAAYPFMKEVPWNSGLYNINPGSADTGAVTKAIGKMIAMGAQMDPKLLAAGADAHHKAIQGLSANGVCPEAQLTAINAAIGRMIASVPESTTMGVYDAVSSIVDPKVPAYLMSTVKEADAALIDFTNVVKANPITSSSPSAPSNPAIDAAAVKLSAAAYPFIKDIDWTDALYSKPIPGKTPQEAMKAVDKMIVMGSKMDGGALRRPPWHMPRPSRAWMGRVFCRRPTSMPSTPASGRRSRLRGPRRRWTFTTRWPNSWGAPLSPTTCSRR